MSSSSSSAASSSNAAAADEKASVGSHSAAGGSDSIGSRSNGFHGATDGHPAAEAAAAAAAAAEESARSSGHRPTRISNAAGASRDAKREHFVGDSGSPLPAPVGVAVDHKEADVILLQKKLPLERSPTVGVPVQKPDSVQPVELGSDAAFLSSVGLERYAPELRARGFGAIEDLVAVRSKDLLEIGLTPVEVNIFKLLQAQIPQATARPRDKSLVDLRVDDRRKSLAWIPEVMVECGICEVSVPSTEAERMECCRVSFCHSCLRRFLSVPIMHDQPLRCPSTECNEHTESSGHGGVDDLTTTVDQFFDENRDIEASTQAVGNITDSKGDAFSLVTVAAIYQDYCLVCCQRLDSSASIRNSCAGLHAFCTACLRGCVVSMVRSHRVPRCPRWRECRQQFIDAAIVDQLCAGDPASLAKFYDLNVENALAIHRFTRLCPRADCGATITIPPTAAGPGSEHENTNQFNPEGMSDVSSCDDGEDEDEWDSFAPHTPVSPGFSTSLVTSDRVATCEECDGRWCTLCWRCAHPGRDCQSAIAIEAKWLQFKELQTDVSTRMQQSIRQYADVLADERYKAKNVRYCPHCGLQCLRTDGCDTVTCGRDAEDKGHKIQYGKGCMQKFNWASAARYEVNAVFCTPELPTEIIKTGTYGVCRPRICECCYSLVQGTCFDDISMRRDTRAEVAELFRGARCRTRFPVTDAVRLADDTVSRNGLTGGSPEEVAARSSLLRIVKDDNTAWVQRSCVPSTSTTDRGATGAVEHGSADFGDGSFPVTLTVSTETQMFQPGTAVHARWKGGSFFPGVVHSIPAEGFYCIHFDDGDKDPHCPAPHVKLKGTETFSPGIGISYTLDEMFLEVDRPRFGELAPTTVVALAYVPVSVAAEVKSSLTPSKAGAAAEKAANAADKAAPAEGTTGPDQSSVVTTKFVTAASQDTLNLMELGFERDLAEFALTKYRRRIQEAANALLLHPESLAQEMAAARTGTDQSLQAPAHYKNAVGTSGEAEEADMLYEWLHVATVKMPDFKSWVSVLNIDDLAVVCSGGGRRALAPEEIDRVLNACKFRLQFYDSEDRPQREVAVARIAVMATTPAVARQYLSRDVRIFGGDAWTQAVKEFQAHQHRLVQHQHDGPCSGGNSGMATGPSSVSHGDTDWGDDDEPFSSNRHGSESILRYLLRPKAGSHTRAHSQDSASGGGTVSSSINGDVPPVCQNLADKRSSDRTEQHNSDVDHEKHRNISNNSEPGPMKRTQPRIRPVSYCWKCLASIVAGVAIPDQNRDGATPGTEGASNVAAGVSGAGGATSIMSAPLFRADALAAGRNSIDSFPFTRLSPQGASRTEAGAGAPGGGGDRSSGGSGAAAGGARGMGAARGTPLDANRTVQLLPASLRSMLGGGAGIGAESKGGLAFGEPSNFDNKNNLTKDSEIVKGAAVHVVGDSLDSPIAKNELALVELVETDPVSILVRSVRGGHLWWFKPDDIRPVTSLARSKACRSAAPIPSEAQWQQSRQGQLVSHCRGISLDLSFHQERLLSSNFRILQPPEFVRSKRWAERQSLEKLAQQSSATQGSESKHDQQVKEDPLQQLLQLEEHANQVTGDDSKWGARSWQQLCSSTEGIVVEYFSKESTARRKRMWRSKQKFHGIQADHESASSPGAAGANGPETGHVSSHAAASAQQQKHEPPYVFSRSCLLWIAWLLRSDQQETERNAQLKVSWEDICGFGRRVPSLASIQNSLSVYPALYVNLCDNVVHSWLEFTGRHCDQIIAPADGGGVFDGTAMSVLNDLATPTFGEAPPRHSREAAPPRSGVARLRPWNYTIGERVEYHFRDHPGIWYGGILTGVNTDGTLAISFDDGDRRSRLPVFEVLRQNNSFSGARRENVPLTTSVAAGSAILAPESQTSVHTDFPASCERRSGDHADGEEVPEERRCLFSWMDGSKFNAESASATDVVKATATAVGLESIVKCLLNLLAHLDETEEFGGGDDDIWAKNRQDSEQEAQHDAKSEMRLCATALLVTIWHTVAAELQPSPSTPTASRQGGFLHDHSIQSAVSWAAAVGLTPRLLWAIALPLEEAYFRSVSKTGYTGSFGSATQAGRVHPPKASQAFATLARAVLIRFFTLAAPLLRESDGVICTPPVVNGSPLSLVVGTERDDRHSKSSDRSRSRAQSSSSGAHGKSLRVADPMGMLFTRWRSNQRGEGKKVVMFHHHPRGCVAYGDPTGTRGECLGHDIQSVSADVFRLEGSDHGPLAEQCLFFELPSKEQPLVRTPHRGTWVFFHDPSRNGQRGHWDPSNALLIRENDFVIASDLDDEASYRWHALTYGTASSSADESASAPVAPKTDCAQSTRFKVDCATAKWGHMNRVNPEPDIFWYRESHIVSFLLAALDVEFHALGIDLNGEPDANTIAWFWQRSSASPCEELLLRAFATLLRDPDTSGAYARMLSRQEAFKAYGLVLRASSLVERGRAALSDRNKQREEHWYEQTIAREVRTMDRLLWRRGLRLPDPVVRAHGSAMKAALLEAFREPSEPGQGPVSPRSSVASNASPKTNSAKEVEQTVELMLRADAAARHHLLPVCLTPGFPQKWQLTDEVGLKGHVTRAGPSAHSAIVKPVVPAEIAPRIPRLPMQTPRRGDVVTVFGAARAAPSRSSRSPVRYLSPSSPPPMSNGLTPENELWVSVGPNQWMCAERTNSEASGGRVQYMRQIFDPEDVSQQDLASLPAMPTGAHVVLGNSFRNDFRAILTQNCTDRVQICATPAPSTGLITHLTVMLQRPLRAWSPNSVPFEGADAPTGAGFELRVYEVCGGAMEGRTSGLFRSGLVRKRRMCNIDPTRVGIPQRLVVSPPLLMEKGQFVGVANTRWDEARGARVSAPFSLAGSSTNGYRIWYSVTPSFPAQLGAQFQVNEYRYNLGFGVDLLQLCHLNQNEASAKAAAAAAAAAAQVEHEATEEPTSSTSDCNDHAFSATTSTHRASGAIDLAASNRSVLRSVTSVASTVEATDGYDFGATTTTFFDASRVQREQLELKLLDGILQLFQLSLACNMLGVDEEPGANPATTALVLPMWGLPGEDAPRLLRKLVECVLYSVVRSSSSDTSDATGDGSSRIMSGNVNPVQRNPATSTAGDDSQDVTNLEGLLQRRAVDALIQCAASPVVGDFDMRGFIEGLEFDFGDPFVDELQRLHRHWANREPQGSKCLQDEELGGASWTRSPKVPITFPPHTLTHQRRLWPPRASERAVWVTTADVHQGIAQRVVSNVFWSTKNLNLADSFEQGSDLPLLQYQSAVFRHRTIAGSEANESVPFSRVDVLYVVDHDSGESSFEHTASKTTDTENSIWQSDRRRLAITLRRLKQASPRTGWPDLTLKSFAAIPLLAPMAGASPPTVLRWFVHVWSPGKMLFTFGVVAETPQSDNRIIETVVAEWTTSGMDDKFMMDWQVDCDVVQHCLRIQSYLPLRHTVLGQTVPEQTLMTTPFVFPTSGSREFNVKTKLRLFVRGSSGHPLTLSFLPPDFAGQCSPLPLDGTRAFQREPLVDIGSPGGGDL